MTPEERNAVIEECASIVDDYCEQNEVGDLLYMITEAVRDLKTAAPQPSTAAITAALSPESVGQGDAAAAVGDQLAEARAEGFAAKDAVQAVVDAAVKLAPMLDEGWDEYDDPADYEAGVNASDELSEAVKKYLALKDQPTATRAGGLPNIGDAYEGGIFAGVSIDGDHRVALVLLPDEADEITWEEATARFELPTRHDMLVLFKNLPGQFKKDWYWASETHASDERYAWCQTFSTGTQHWGANGSRCNARAVRRVLIGEPR